MPGLTIAIFQPCSSLSWCTLRCIWGVSTPLSSDSSVTHPWGEAMAGCVWAPAADQEQISSASWFAQTAERFSVNLDQLIESLPTEICSWNLCGIMLGESSSNIKILVRERKILPGLIPSAARSYWPLLCHCSYPDGYCCRAGGCFPAASGNAGC